MNELHPSTHAVLRWFDSEHLSDELREVVAPLHSLAWIVAKKYSGGGPELTAGLRHLLEAKDCFVRAAIVHREGSQ